MQFGFVLYTPCLYCQRHTVTPPVFSLLLLRMATTKANTYRLYLNDDSAALMGKICDTTGLTQSDLLSKVVVAGLSAIAVNRHRITLPLKFEIVEEHNDLALPQGASRRR